ncbi:MAG: metallophosphoesterase [Cyclobacteriaceae bacterium]
MKRRELINLIGLGTLAPLTGVAATSKKSKKPALRIAHLTDIHLNDNKDAVRNFRNCLQHLQMLGDPADVVFNGGDCIMDALGVEDKSRVDLQWNTFERSYQSESDLEIIHCIGNHDVWAGTSKTDPLYGKKYATERLNLDKPYYSFDRAGWHFIVLDSTHPVGEGWYTARLDEEQMAWLKDDLEKTPSDASVFVMSHIPILSVSVFYTDNVKNNAWQVPGGWMHLDFLDIQKLFLAHGNVKLCVSGHMHLIDQLNYNGINYVCNGAVSGSWWSDPYYHESKAGYAMINLYADGSFEREFVHYDWS